MRHKCCKGKGRHPAIKIYRSGQNETWYAVVGTVMLTNFTDKRKLFEAAELAKLSQRVLRCGHTLRDDKYTDSRKLRLV